VIDTILPGKASKLQIT